MEICWTCIAMVVGSGLIVHLLDRFFLNSSKKEIQIIKEESEMAKLKLSKVTDEYNQYKAKATNRIEDGEKEIDKLSKLNIALSREQKPSKTQNRGLTQAQLDHKYTKWKKRSEDLSNELEYLKAKINSNKKQKLSTEINDDALSDLKSQLSKAVRKIKEQDLLLMQAKKESFPTSKSSSKKSGKKKKKIAELTAQVKKLKQKLKKKKTKN